MGKYSFGLFLFCNFKEALLETLGDQLELSTPRGGNITIQITNHNGENLYID
jgi:hypothetical protein